MFIMKLSMDVMPLLSYALMSASVMFYSVVLTVPWLS